MLPSENVDIEQVLLVSEKDMDGIEMVSIDFKGGNSWLM